MTKKTIFKTVVVFVVVAFSVAMFTALGGCEASAKTKPTVKKMTAEKAVKTAKKVKGKAKPKKSAIPRRNDAGMLKADTTTLDLGIVEPKQRVTRKLTLRNTGKETLEIDRKIKKSCGCTVPKLKSYTLQPGQSTELSITYSAGAHPGKISKKIWISTKAPAKPEKLTITIVGKIRKHIENTPAKLEFQLRDVEQNKIPIILESLDGKPFKITAVNSTKKVVSVTFDPEASQIKHTLSVCVDLAKLREASRGEVSITTDHKTVKKVSVPFKVLMPFQAHPGRVNFQQIKANKTQKRTVTIVSNYAEQFEIESIESQKGLLEIGEPTKSKDGYRFDVSITAKELTKTVMADSIIIKIKDRPQDTIKVYCYGRSAKTKKHKKGVVNPKIKRAPGK